MYRNFRGWRRRREKVRKKEESNMVGGLNLIIDMVEGF